MKRIIALLALTFSLAASAQNSAAILLSEQSKDTLTIVDTTIKFLKVGDKTIAVKDLFKKDTVAMPVFVIERTDTAKVNTVLYEGRGNRVYKASPGYYIYKQQVATSDGKNFQPVGQPVIIGAMDEKMRAVKPITN